MRIDILTLLPGLLESYLQEGMIGRACREGLIQISAVQIRDFATDRHKTADDSPYGGGAGLIMKAEPLAGAIKAAKGRKKARILLMSPQGRTFSHDDARRLANEKHLIIICGRYEGLDERIRQKYVDEEFSIGDYVLTGGELAALVIADATARFIQGVLGNEQSSQDESFSAGMLEYPQYTKPRVFLKMAVPEVLLSGNHAQINRWRRTQALLKTMKNRPDLFAKLQLTSEDRKEIENNRE